MIIGRSPLRISLGGGGTDLPSYYREHGGFLVAAAITKYVYVSMHETPLRELEVHGTRVRFEAGAREVVTVVVESGGLTV